MSSRAEGKRLTDWIIDAVEGHMQQQMARISIPADLDFSALRLGRESDGGVSFDAGVIERICEASGVSSALFLDAQEDNVAGLIIRWYLAHRADGGDPDPVAEDLIAEVKAEDAAGQPYGLPPGRA